MRPAAGRLLRWYPRAWRERYGEEFTALIEDTLDGGPPTLRLRLGVAGAGLRERARHAVSSAAQGLRAGRLPTFLVGGYIVAALLYTSRRPAAAGWRAPVAVGAEAALALLGGVFAVATGLLLVPALVRCRRAGTWPAIRRLAGWAAGTTAAAGGALAGLALAGLALAPGEETLPFFLGILGTSALTGTAIGLWAAVARRVDRSRRARVLAEVTGTATFATFYVLGLWLSAVDSSMSLLCTSMGGLAVCGWTAPSRIRRAARTRQR